MKKKLKNQKAFKKNLLVFFSLLSGMMKFSTTKALIFSYDFKLTLCVLMLYIFYLIMSTTRAQIDHTGSNSALRASLCRSWLDPKGSV